MGRLYSWIPAIRDRVSSEQFRPYLLTIIFCAALAFPYVDGNEGDIDAAANACSYAMLALGLNIVVGFAGLLDLGYAAFFAIGAYTYGALSSYQIQPPWSSFWEPFQWLGLVTHLDAGDGVGTVHLDVSFWLMLPISAVVAAFFGLLFGVPTLRLKGDYLAIVTLGFGEIVPIVARNTPYITNGAQGLSGVATPKFFGYNFGVMSTPYYYLGLALIVLLIFISTRLKHSRVGRAWLAIREDEIAAEAMGVNRTKLKLLAFAIGAGFAGVTGTFYVAKLQTASPEMFMFPVSIKGLAKSFGGIKAVSRIDLDVMPGSIVAIIGPNGSGKTTFFNLITGLIEPDGGHVLLAGEDVTGLKPHRIVGKGIARTFQNLRLFAKMTLMENAQVVAHPRA